MFPLSQKNQQFELSQWKWIEPFGYQLLSSQLESRTKHVRHFIKIKLTQPLVEGQNNILFRFEILGTSDDEISGVFSLFGESEKPLFESRFYFGENDKRKVAFNVKLPNDTDTLYCVFFLSKETVGDVYIRQLEVFTESGFTTSESDLKDWSCIPSNFEWSLESNGSIRAYHPLGSFMISALDAKTLTALQAGLSQRVIQAMETLILKNPLKQSSPTTKEHFCLFSQPDKSYDKTKTQDLIAFSGGDDSSFVHTLFPQALTYQCIRTFDSYHRHDGKKHHTKARPQQKGKGRDADYIIYNDLELFYVGLGGPIKFDSIYGYAIPVIPFLDFLNARSISFGYEFTEIFLASVGKFRSLKNVVVESDFKLYKNVMLNLGVYFSVPIACISEVTTARLSESMGLETSSCPYYSEAGPCYKCLKCMRKLALRRKNEKILANYEIFKAKLLRRPLMAAPTMNWACRKLNIFHEELHDFGHLDTNFLEKYYEDALRNLVFHEHQPILRDTFRKWKVESMTPEDLSNAANWS